jgi:hypothetical protein
VRDHPKRDWPDVLGLYPIPLWILEMEGRIARWETEGRQIAKLFAANQPGVPFPGTAA